MQKEKRIGKDSSMYSAGRIQAITKSLHRSSKEVGNSVGVCTENRVMFMDVDIKGYLASSRMVSTGVGGSKVALGVSASLMYMVVMLLRWDKVP